MAIYKGTVDINGQSLTIIEEQGQRVLTTDQLAAGFGTTSDSIKQNFKRNKSRFTEGKHYFVLEGESLQNLRVTSSHLQISSMTRKLYLWTERGAARHSKILDTDEAWAMFDILEKHYFEQEEVQETKPMSSLEILQHQVAVMTEHEKRLNSLETDIAQLRTAHNGMSLRYETDIADIKVTIAERSPRANIKALIEDTVREYANTEQPVDYGHAYACFYAEVKRVIGLDILTEYEALQQRRREEGWFEGRISKISKIEVIEEYPDIWSSVKALISTLREENGI